MNQIKLLCVLSILALLSACAGTGNNVTGGNGFVTNAKGMIWKNAFGECWGHSGRDANSSHPECGGAPSAPVDTPVVDTKESGYFWPDDQDRDSVTDAEDACPFTPEGITVDSNGCAKDTDDDGVPNYLDLCPGTPAGAVVNTDGCTRKMSALTDVHFEFNSATLTSEAKSILDDVAQTINARADASITVEGHTDSSGPDVYNQFLSEQRADSVKNYLVSKGVSVGITAIGRGEGSPAYSNDTKEGRSANRRVEVLAK